MSPLRRIGAPDPTFQRLSTLVAGARFFYTPHDETGLTVGEGAAARTFPIRSSEMFRWLLLRYDEEFGVPARVDLVRGMLDILDTRAFAEGELREEPLYPEEDAALVDALVALLAPYPHFWYGSLDALSEILQLLLPAGHRTCLHSNMALARRLHSLQEALLARSVTVRFNMDPEDCQAAARGVSLKLEVDVTEEGTVEEGAAATVDGVEALCAPRGSRSLDAYDSALGDEDPAALRLRSGSESVGAEIVGAADNVSEDTANAESSPDRVRHWPAPSPRVPPAVFISARLADRLARTLAELQQFRGEWVGAPDDLYEICRLLLPRGELHAEFEAVRCAEDLIEVLDAHERALARHGVHVEFRPWTRAAYWVRLRACRPYTSRARRG